MLILPVTVPRGVHIKGHMNTDDAVCICRQVEPEVCVFIHLGIDMLKHIPDEQARICGEASGVRTVAGRDLMVMDVGKDAVSFSQAERYPDDDGWFPARDPHSRQPNRGPFFNRHIR